MPKYIDLIKNMSYLAEHSTTSANCTKVVPRKYTFGRFRPVNFLDNVGKKSVNLIQQNQNINFRSIKFWIYVFASMTNKIQDK